jgi:hypothetical protein
MANYYCYAPFLNPVFISSYLLISEKQEVSGMVGFVCENSIDAVYMVTCASKQMLTTVSHACMPTKVHCVYSKCDHSLHF